MIRFTVTRQQYIDAVWLLSSIAVVCALLAFNIERGTLLWWLATAVIVAEPVRWMWNATAQRRRLWSLRRWKGTR